MNKIKELVDKLNYYTKLYDEGQPQISDKEWDDMYFELVALEKETGIYLPDSPTQKVNFTIISKLEKVKHDHLMLSLNKTKTIDDIASLIKDNKYIGMCKMDGLTCSLTYKDGKLIKAETRGNGEIGENILHNALVIPSIPNKINNKNKIVVDGEIICTYENFKKFEKDYENPRNFAAGSIRLLNSKESYNRHLTFVAWDAIRGIDKTLLSEKLTALENLGFEVVPFLGTKLNSPNIIQDMINHLKDKAKDLDYPIDGIVFKIDNIKLFNEAGRTAHHFSGGIAYKFYDEEYETELEDIEWTMGRTGVLTPVAIFKPVRIEGSTVTRASLHNISIMKALLGDEPYIGQKIWVIKSNQIIPQITRAEV